MKAFAAKLTSTKFFTMYCDESLENPPPTTRHYFDLMDCDLEPGVYVFDSSSIPVQQILMEVKEYTPDPF